MEVLQLTQQVYRKYKTINLNSFIENNHDSSCVHIHPSGLLFMVA